MDEQLDDGAIGHGALLALEQSSVRRRDDELRRGDEVLGWLRFPAFGGSASAWAGPTAGLLCLVGGFLALRSLQADLDGGAAGAGIMAVGAG